MLIPVLILLCFSVGAQNAFWSNNGLVSIKSAAYLSIIGDAYNQGNGIYDNSDSIFITGDWKHDAANRCFDSIGKGWVYFYAADQRIKGSVSTHFNNLVLKNQGVKYGDIDVYVDDSLFLTDREFHMDTNTVWELNPDTGSIKRSTGYVSSLQDGGLLRRTNSALPYLFAVGSNVGFFRYRPVEFAPLAANQNHYKARFANVDPTVEGFDKNTKAIGVCQVNFNWYHRLWHITGSDSAMITIMYDTTADGKWDDIVHWQNVPEWERIYRDTILPLSPFNRISKFVWNNYNYKAFALAIVSDVTLAGNVTDVNCNGDANGAIELIVKNAKDSYNIYWSNGDTTSTITGLSGGTYYVTVAEANRCLFSDTFKVFEPTAVTSSIKGTDDSCWAGSNGIADLTVNGGTPPYTFLWNTGATTEDINRLPAGTYNVLVTDSHGCVKTDTVVISQPDRNPYIVAGVDTIMWRGDTIQLNGFYGNDYNWTPNYNLSCVNCHDPLAWPDSDVTYHLSIGDEKGCFYSDSVKIFVRDKPFTLLFIPNVITPNGDGFNDTWYIRDLERYPDNAVRIVNRWGDEVFEQKPYQNNWAGTWKGENLPGATYYYVLKITFNGEEHDFNGPLTIVR